MALAGAANEGPPIPVSNLVRRLLALAWRHRWVALPAVIATVLGQLLTLGVLAGQGLGIDVIRASLDASAPRPAWPLGLDAPAGWSLEAQIGVISAVVLGISALGGVARFFTRYCDERFVQACVVDLRQRLYDKVQRLPFSFFDGADTGQIINRIAGDSQEVRFFIQGVMIRAGIAAITLAIFLAFMLKTHVWLTVACCVVYPAQVLVMVRYSRLTKPKFLAQSKMVDGLVKALAESIAGVRVIRVFGAQRRQLEAFDRRSIEARDQRLTIARDQATHTPFVQATNLLAQGLLLGLGGWLVLRGPAEGGIALGTFWIFRGLLDRLAGQAEAIVSIIGETPEALAGAERVFKLLDRPVEIRSRAPAPGDTDGSAPADPAMGAGAGPAGGRRVRGEVVFRDVSFAYKTGPRVLDRVSFTARAGEVIAVVGPTGAGKSTLLSLIPRFHDACEGSVLIDGLDVRDWPLEHLRKSVGFVFQEPFLFSNTVRANVAFGVPDAPEHLVLEALQAAAARGFVEEMPQGAGTVVGERGVSLSGGQRQRLTIARALVVDPAILVLDDATGSVDALTESEIQRALDQHMRGRTTFIVAHRLSTLRRADRILVLDHGRIVDVGTHDELMSRPGHYRAAGLIQLALDREDLPETVHAEPRQGPHAGAPGGAR